MDESSEGSFVEQMEKVSPSVKEIASSALAEIRSAQQTGLEVNPLPEIRNLDGSGLKTVEEYSTQAVTDLKIVMRDAAQNSQNPDENLKKIMFALRDAHLAMDDEKISVPDKINEIMEILDRFIDNPNDFRQKNLSITRQLIEFCENLSRG